MVEKYSRYSRYSGDRGERVMFGHYIELAGQSTQGAEYGARVGWSGGECRMMEKYGSGRLGSSDRVGCTERVDCGWQRECSEKAAAAGLLAEMVWSGCLESD